MNVIIGIRREDKNRWESRVPLVPQDVKRLIDNYDVKIVVQPSTIRAFPDREFIDVGAGIKEDISDSQFVFAVKEIPIDFFVPNKTYIFFSHTIKGQSYNMSMLKRMMKLGCTLIDYERILDEKGRRLIAFGRYAGLAGMLDTLWAFGKRLEWKGINNPFAKIKRGYKYSSIKEAKEHIETIGKEIIEDGIHKSISPVVCGFMGYGNVSKGAQEILDCLPIEELEPDTLLSSTYSSNRVIYKTVFKESDMVESTSENPFDLLDYYHNPSGYQSKFNKFIPYITILMNCIYWESKYPRFVTKQYLKEYSGKEDFRLRIIGDISCDIEGAVECTVHSTEPDKPVYVYDPFTDTTKDGYKGEGVVIMAVDNLPCELPLESSAFFSNTLMKFIPNIIKANFPEKFDECNLPDEVKKGVILYKGKLTEEYRYLKKYIRVDR